MIFRHLGRTAAEVVAGSILAIPLLGGMSANAWARPLQIIHTNDLHSHLDHSMDPTLGGYAAVKAVIDKIKGEAQAAGIDTLVLDAGDFTEDSQFYLANEGLEAWHAMNAMGYDAVTIGNHDWFQGLVHLDQMVGLANPSFTFLGANFIFGWENKNLVKHMRQYIEVVKGGSKIAVLGLTTDDSQYAWMSDPGFIYNPEYEASEDVPKLRTRNDYVIALTHLGVAADRSLIRRTKGIDLVVGGHSHTELQKPSIEKDPTGKSVSIVQTGMHGRNVGDLLVDVEPGKPLVILHYRLVPVLADGPKDENMQRIVDHAREELDRDYGKDWLSEVVGRSEVPLENAYYKDEPTVWSRFVADAIREAGDAEAAVDATQFEGFDQPAGPITREQLFVLYPRIFEFEKHFGWTVWTTNIQGWILKLALTEAFSQGLPIQASGITYDLDSQGKATHFKINGESFVSSRSYKIAAPEGIIRGAFGLSKYLHIILKNSHDTGIPMWAATEAKLKRVGVIKAVISEP